MIISIDYYLVVVLNNLVWDKAELSYPALRNSLCACAIDNIKLINMLNYVNGKDNFFFFFQTQKGSKFLSNSGCSYPV